MTGRFITFEGGEGSGKSSQINLLKSKLMDKGIEIICTREPGGTPSAEILRELVTTGEVNKWEPMTEAAFRAAVHVVRRHSERYGNNAEVSRLLNHWAASKGVALKALLGNIEFTADFSHLVFE